jgi:alkylhydroperoxidase family enzyme
VGGRSGVPAAKLQALLPSSPPAGVLDVFDELELLAVRLADAMTATPAVVPDELFLALRNKLSPAQLVELASAIAWEQYRSRFNRVFDVQSAGLAAGEFCLVPPRRTPAPPRQ